MSEAEAPTSANDVAVTGLIDGPDGRRRCFWAGEHADYIHYHDTEWGRPVASDVRLFEKMSLEGFQSGLSWLTILRKRENFRKAFAGFDIAKVARFTEADVERLLQDAGIIRHRGKITATINNAQKLEDLLETEPSFAAYIWRFEPNAADRPDRFDRATLMKLAKTPASAALAKDLKSRGFRFFGPTTAYAFMQAMGLVNDHLEGCPQRAECLADRAEFVRPS